MKKPIAQIYDEFADTYEQNRGLFDMTEVFDGFLRRFQPRTGAVLDLGCGAGEPLATSFIQRGWSVTGVDSSSRMLELAARYVPAMERIQADMREVRFEPARFDAVTIIYALFHVPRQDHAALFGQVFHWLKPSGRLLFTYATRDYTGQEAFEGYKEFMGQELFYSHKQPEQLYGDLEQIGFVLEAKDYRAIGGETFLWITAAKPA